ncbi:MAG: response regulator [Gemmatimonadetes bacterium]|nr:response regulator [Gemmatimonadota bacterium]
MILIVEDSPDNMKLFRTLLTLKGHEIVGLMGGEELFATLAAKLPDLVLMDIQMPGKDGFALLAEIRASEYRELRVVALTAHAMAGDRERAMSAGFDGSSPSRSIFAPSPIKCRVRSRGNRHRMPKRPSRGRSKSRGSAGRRSDLPPDTGQPASPEPALAELPAPEPVPVVVPVPVVRPAPPRTWDTAPPQPSHRRHSSPMR